MNKAEVHLYIWGYLHPRCCTVSVRLPRPLPPWAEGWMNPPCSPLYHELHSDPTPEESGEPDKSLRCFFCRKKRHRFCVPEHSSPRGEWSDLLVPHLEELQLSRWVGGAIRPLAGGITPSGSWISALRPSLNPTPVLSPVWRGSGLLNCELVALWWFSRGTEGSRDDFWVSKNQTVDELGEHDSLVRVVCCPLVSVACSHRPAETHRCPSVWTRARFQRCLSP